MLKYISISDFKSISNASVNLSQLSLFVGPNSAGKSTAIQALLHLLDRNAGRSVVEALALVGEFSDTRNFITNARRYRIAVADDIDGRFEMDFSSDDSMSKIIASETEPNPVLSEKLRALDYIWYLPAHRVSDYSWFRINQNPNTLIGTNEEFLIDYYHNHKLDIVRDELITDHSSKTLEYQVDYWLAQMTDGFKLRTEKGANQYDVFFETSSHRRIRPVASGTGVSYIAHLIIACLAAPKGSLIVIENPEIHIHPNAQADMVDFFSMIAQSGVQMIIETHSDHVFNGVRRLISTNKIDKASVSVEFFCKNDQSLTEVHSIEIGDSGEVLTFHSKLFDQFDKDLDAILGL